jgi:hypothetical protein
LFRTCFRTCAVCRKKECSLQPALLYCTVRASMYYLYMYNRLT